jgi:regulator of cell morphogenesis and NO signaling
MKSSILEKVEHLGKGVNFNELRADKLTEYIVENHHPSIRSALSRYAVHSKTILKLDITLHPEVVMIDKYVTELTKLVEQHLDFEEFIFFPYVKGLVYGDIDELDHELESPMERIKNERSRIKELLRKIRTLSDNYTPAINSSPALKLCYAQLFDLEQDVHKHSFLEENILFSKLNELEKRKTKI